MKKFGIYMTGNVSESIEENIKAMADAGFRYTFIGWSEELDVGERISICRKDGIEIDNFHAPFHGINCMWYTGDEGEKYLERLKKCVLDAEKYGVKYIIVHPTAGAPEPATSAVGIRHFRELANFSKEHGVKRCSALL